MTAVLLATLTLSTHAEIPLGERRSSYEQWALPLDDALSNEFERGVATIASGETLEGAARFASGAGRHGEPASS